MMANIVMSEPKHLHHCTALRLVAAHTRLPLTQTPLPAGFGTIGLFAEDSERPGVNIFKQVQKKQLLSTVEKAGLLS